MKMLRVFSNQLRSIHRKIESILKSTADVDQSAGMTQVAKSFYADEQYKSCCDICFKLLKHFPKAKNKEVIAKLYSDAKLRAEKTAKRQQQPSKPAVINSQEASDSAVLKAFSLPSFERFAKEFEKDSVIIAEYEPGATFYLIQEGHVQLVKCVNDAKKNLDILHSGEIFGEMAILENTPRSATCVALDKVKALEFNKENFELLVTGNSQLALMLLRLFCKRIFDQKRRFRVLCIHDLPTRIADVILLFDEMNPVANTAERSRRFNLTVQDIAHWAGVPVEVAREEMGKFSERRKIDIYESHIVVNNIVDLRRTVDQRLQMRHATTRI
jgi:CRP-like cAMP-binding protein